MNRFLSIGFSVMMLLGAASIARATATAVIDEPVYLCALEDTSVDPTPANRSSHPVGSSLTPSKTDGWSAANRTGYPVTSSLRPAKTSPGALNQAAMPPLSTLKPLKATEVNPSAAQVEGKIKSSLSPR